MYKLIDKIKLTETIKLNKYHDTELQGLGRMPRFTVTQEQTKL
jgi:hypothetical protein